MHRRATVLVVIAVAVVVHVSSASFTPLVLPPQCRPQRPPVAPTSLNSTLGASPTSIVVADVNADGRPDVVGLFLSSHKRVAVHVQQPDRATYTELVLASEPSISGSTSGLAVADLNGDTDTDIVFAAGALGWYEGFKGTFLAPTVIAAGPGYECLSAGDVNGDGDVDLAACYDHPSLASEDRLDLFVNNGDGTFGAPVALVTGDFVTAVKIVDLFGSGSLDIVGRSTPIFFLANVGAGVFGARVDLPLPPAASFAYTFDVGDVNGDGAVDIVASFTTSPNGVIAWYPGVPGPSPPSFAPPVSLLALSNNQFTTLTLVDLDADGALDVVANSVRFFNAGAGRAFVSPPDEVADGTVYAAGDMDGDGLADLVTKFAITYNTPKEKPSLEVTSATTIVSGGASSVAVRAVAVADFDLDGAVDVAWTVDVSSSLFWAANEDTTGAFSAPRAIDTAVLGAVDLIAVDLDVDGDADLVGIYNNGPADSIVVWYENTNARGVFAPRVVIDAAAPDQLAGVVALDMGADGSIDLALTSTMSVVWYENNDGVGGSWSKHTLTTLSQNAGLSIVAVDINNDGLDDLVIGTSAFTDRILTYASPSYSFAATVALYSGSDIEHIDAADLDGDGDTDLAVIEFTADEIAWFRNDGAFPFVKNLIHIVSEGPVSPVEIVVADLDADGDYDLVVATRNGVTTPVGMWFENVDGAGAFVGPQPVTLPPGVVNVFRTADVNGDGLPDLVVGYTTDGVGGAAEAALAWAPSLATTAFANPATPLLFSHALGPRTGASAQSCAVPSTFACWWASVPSRSKCHADPLALPPGLLSCVRDAHARVTFPLTLTGASAGTSAFECDGNVLFSVVPSSATIQGATTGGLSLANVTITGTGVAAVAIDAAPGIRVVGPGTTVTLSSVVITAATSAAVPGRTILDAGFGGALLCSGGCAAALDRSTISGSSAGDAGGALAVASGSTATLVDTDVIGNSAGGRGGGGVFVDATSSLRVVRGVVMSNTASSGGGGGVLLDAGPSLASAINGTRFESNRARVGGALSHALPTALETTLAAASVADVPRVTSADGVSPDAAPAPATVTLGNVVLVGNAAATWGGGLFVCGAATVVDGVETAWSTSSARMGDSADAFLCALAPGVTLPLGWAPGRTRAGLPWLRVLPAVSEQVFAGARVASAPGSLAWSVRPSGAAPSVMAGAVVESAVATTDWLGEDVSFPTLRLRVTAAPASACVSALPSLTIDALAPTAVSALPALEPVFTAASAECEAAAASLSVAAVVVDSSDAVVGGVGQVIDVVGVAMCAPGFGSVVSSAGFVRCVACEDGTVAGTTSLAPCSSLASCGANAVRVDGGNVTGGACACEPRFWAPPGSSGAAGSGCEPCPTGGMCAGGTAQPTAAPGFFPGPSATTFVACPTREACVGGGQCAVGYQSRACSECAPGYYRLRGKCEACKSGLGTLVAVLFAVGATACLLGLLMFNLAPGVRHRFAALMIGLNGLQISAIYGELDLAWGPVADVYFNVASSLNLNLELTSPECAAAPGVDMWVATFAFTLCLPLVCGLLLGLVAALVAVLAAVKVGWFADMGGAVLWGGVQRTFFQLLVLLYLPITRAAFSVFGCVKDESGRWALAADPARSCYTSAWWALAAVAMVGVGVYGCGIPVATYVLLSRARVRLDAITFVLRYGFLVGRFCDAAFWFEVAIMGRKVVLVMALTFFARDTTKASAGVIVLMGSLAQLLVARPYALRIHNVVAAVVLAATATVLHGGTIDANTLRTLCVVGGIVATVVTIVVGNVLDVVASLRSERVVEENEFYAPGVFKNGAACDDSTAPDTDLELTVLNHGAASDMSCDITCRTVDSFASSLGAPSSSSSC